MRRVDVWRLRFEEPEWMKEETVLTKGKSVNTVFAVGDGNLPIELSSPRQKEETCGRGQIVFLPRDLRETGEG